MKRNVYETMLTEKDLTFVVETVAPDIKNKELIKKMIYEDPQCRNSFTGNDLLFRQVVADNPVNLEISPILYFEVLLKQAVKEMENATHTVERTISQKIPVFDIKETLELLEKEEVFYYLIRLLASFVRCNKEGVNDIDIDRLIQLSKKAITKYRFNIYKRIADTCLFILGIFPEYVMYDYYYLFVDKKIPISGEARKSMGEYEELGREFYELASRHASAEFDPLDEVLELLSQNFYLAKKPLNFISEHYLVFGK